ncbi:MAG: HEAT repeat domain-containing protein [Polyangiaceae bacterium]|nr:HEAT repeat domain-containing protein [Polyangiaceae bacterium]MCW5790085.1 HEAT repeat domain-containing protein [Polyangiaceae bacterium]
MITKTKTSPITTAPQACPRWRNLARALFIVATLLACKGGSKEDAKQEAEADPTGVVQVKIDEVRDLVKEGEPITAAQYEKLILAHATCEVTDNGIDGKCEAVKILRESMNRSQLAKDVFGGNTSLGQKLIGHSSPAVRIKAAEMMGSLLGTAKSSQTVLVEAARKEQHPAVLTAMIRTIRNDGARNADVGKLLLELADHTNPKIRTEAVYALSSTWNRELKGGPEKLIAMMEGDADAGVRKAACEYAGKLGDAKLFATYQKLLKQKGDEDLWGKCFQGLVAMWADYPLYGNSHQGAYQLTLQLLEQTPRTDKTPPWFVMSTFGHLGSKTNDKLKEWKAKATWYKPDALRKALIAVVGDSKVNWMARTGATKSLVELGATKADFQKLRKPLGDAPKGTDSHVAKELDTAIAKAP